MKSKAALGAIALCVCSPLWAQRIDAAARATLAGLTGIRPFLITEPAVSPTSTIMLQNEVERMLLAYNVPVVADSEATPAAELTVFIVVSCKRRGWCATQITLQLVQKVLLMRDPTIAGYAATWENAIVGPANPQSPDRFDDDARAGLNYLLHQFVDAYLAANPTVRKPQ